MPLFRRRQKAGSGAGPVHEMNPGYADHTMYLNRMDLVRHAKDATGYLHSGNEVLNNRLAGQLQEAHEAGDNNAFRRHATALGELHANALHQSGFSHSMDGARAHLTATAGKVGTFSMMHSTNSNLAHLAEVHRGGSTPITATPHDEFPGI